MIAFATWLLPEGVLVHCLNAALASLVACAVALLLVRRTSWSLPARHALLTVALATGLLLPLVLPLLHVPTPWTLAMSRGSTDQPTAHVEQAASRPDPADLPQRVSSGSPLLAADPAASPPRVGPNASEQSVRAEQARTEAPVLPLASPGNWLRLAGSLACALWFLGVAVGFVRTAATLAKLQRWLKTASVADDPLLAEAARNLGRRTAIRLYCSSTLPAPISLGLLRPRIVVPAGLESRLAPDQLRAVIQHEVAHIRRGDLWIGLLQQIAGLLYWWNPLVHLVNQQIAEFREQICDDIATAELPEPRTYATTLLQFSEGLGLFAHAPATLGIGAGSTSQLEKRIRRIVSPAGARRVRLTRSAIAGTAAAAVLMSAAILSAQVGVPPSAAQQSGDPAPPPEPAPAAQDPTLADLIQRMAAYERMYFPYNIQALETFRFPDDLTPQERAANLRADGRKHQRLMEYAQLERRIWRRRETDLVDDEVEQGPYDQVSDGERIVQRSPSSASINGVRNLEYYVNNRANQISNYLYALPLNGVFCLSSYSAGELFSQAFADEEGIELAWDNGDARLTFGYGQPHWNMKFVLWLSRDHDWHPVRLQRFMDTQDELFHDEWEVTRFVQHGGVWRVAEGTQRYRERSAGGAPPDPRIRYSMDFEVLSEQYGDDVDVQQFQIEIPAGAAVRTDDEPDEEPAPATETRQLSFRVDDVAGRPIPHATVRLPANRLHDYDVVTTDEQGVATSLKVPLEAASVLITADGFRPAHWIAGTVDELHAILVPQSSGLVVYRGHPVADAWVTSELLQVRADGYVYVPARDWDGRDDDWSIADGSFQLLKELTLRSRDAVVPLVAVDPDRTAMAIRFVPAAELGQPQELTLQPVCHVTGHCLLAGMTESIPIAVALETPAGISLGGLSVRRELTGQGLRVDFQLRLPPGQYLLRSQQPPQQPGFVIPFTIGDGQEKVDLGTTTIPPT